MGHEVLHVCGGDILNGWNGVPWNGLIPHSQFGRSPRHKKVLSPVVHTVSEWRDIRHDASMLGSLEQFCGSFRPDVVWERSSRLHCAGLTLARQIGVPYVLEWKDHLVDYRFSLFRGRALRMESRKNGEADHIVVESGVLRDALGREGIDTRKIVVAHNAVTVREFRPDEGKRQRVRKELDVHDGTVLAGYLGSYAFYHDAARLVLAADIIRRRDEAAKIKILMVGAGKENLICRKLAEARGLLNDVLIMRPGVPKDEVPGILSALDIAVLPGSTDIICPIKVQEYMACELPSIVPDYACNREVLRDGETGVLFKPRDEESLADKIGDLATDMQLRLRMGRAARQEVERRFTWERTWGAALQRILSLTGSSLE
jgi:glycosyltransferase involved in cell wall biosynthesis